MVLQRMQKSRKGNKFTLKCGSGGGIKTPKIPRKLKVKRKLRLLRKHTVEYHASVGDLLITKEQKV
jgi:hypothetical protein